MRYFDENGNEVFIESRKDKKDKKGKRKYGCLKSIGLFLLVIILFVSCVSLFSDDDFNEGVEDGYESVVEGEETEEEDTEVPEEEEPAEEEDTVVEEESTEETVEEKPTEEETEEESKSLGGEIYNQNHEQFLADLDKLVEDSEGAILDIWVDGRLIFIALHSDIDYLPRNKLEEVLYLLGNTVVYLDPNLEGDGAKNVYFVNRAGNEIATYKMGILNGGVHELEITQ